MAKKIDQYYLINAYEKENKRLYFPVSADYILWLEKKVISLLTLIEEEINGK